VGEKNRGHDFVSGSAIEQPSFFLRYRIGFELIGKRKNVSRKEDRRSGLCIARRLREAIVEAAAACSRYVRENSIERESSFLIGIEALIQEIAKKSAILRNAFAIDARGRSYRIRA